MAEILIFDLPICLSGTGQIATFSVRNELNAPAFWDRGRRNSGTNNSPKTHGPDCYYTGSLFWLAELPCVLVPAF
jgi:hypothetical protein